ncbi:hypothetical protein ACX80H_00620 [Arthrobacter sp. MDT2-2]
MNDEWSRLQPALRPGEQLRWAGRPDPKVRFTPADAYLVPFSLMWGGFAIFWEVQVLTSDQPAFFALWGVPFVLFGLYFIFGRFIYKARQKSRTVYGLTDTQAIVSTSERSFSDTRVQDAAVRTDRSRDGRHASFIFGGSRRAAYQNTGMDFFNVGQEQGISFFDVADPDTMLRELDQVR